MILFLARTTCGLDGGQPSWEIGPPQLPTMGLTVIGFLGIFLRKLLWRVRFEGEVFFIKWVYNPFLVHRVRGV